jgi:hypothetical protein
MKRFLRIALKLCAVLFITWLAFILLQQSAFSITLHQALQTHLLFLDLWRYVVIALLALLWSRFINLIGRWRKLDSELIQKLTQLRWWALVFFIAMELLIAWSR